jgi:hypothetical protein
VLLSNPSCYHQIYNYNLASMIKATNSISLTVTQMNKEINWTLVDVKNIRKEQIKKI